MFGGHPLDSALLFGCSLGQLPEALIREDTLYVFGTDPTVWTQLYLPGASEGLLESFR